MKLMGYIEWCDWMAKRYDVMPHWYWSATSRMEAYHGYRKAAEDWNEKYTPTGRLRETAEDRAHRLMCWAVPASDDTGQDQAHPAQCETQAGD